MDRLASDVNGETTLSLYGVELCKGMSRSRRIVGSEWKTLTDEVVLKALLLGR